jgi:hypothetical protein
MVNLVHEVIDASVIVVSNPRERVAEGLFQGVFEACSKGLLAKASWVPNSLFKN